jgi:histidyl-tRNA synthetase
MTIPSGPKGTRDFYPDLMAQQEFLFSSWKKTCRRYGFEPYEGPMFEHLDLFKQKSGDEIEGQLYVFTDKKGRELALRPEMTPTLARMVAAAGSNLKWPVRWYSIPRLFRYEKMQKGRLREFFQLNMDILGVAGVSADAELIAAAIDMMRDLGLNANDFKVRISSRTLVDDLFSEAGLSGAQRNAVFVHLDKKSKIPPPVFEEGLAAIVTDTAMRGNIQRMLAARSLDQLAIQGPEPASLTSLRQLFALLIAYGLDDYAVFDIGVVRGLAYYTGIVFELFDAAGSMRAIAGGGRYDRLVELYDGPATDCFIITFAADPPGEVIALARELRAEGISCEFALKQANPGKQMKIANAARATYALFTGGEESDAGMIKVKNMGSGEEHLIPRSSIASEMHKLKVEGR